MNCTNARLLLNFVRTGELDSAERENLDGHVAGCPECAALAQAESRLDDALETAMQRVPVPAGLKGKILGRLAQKRRPRPWPWAAAAAVVLVVAGWTGYRMLLGGPQEFETSKFVEEYVDLRSGLSPDALEARFSDELKIAMKAPREFNYSLLDTYDTAKIQDCLVPRLTFLSRSENALAYVYVLSSKQFKPPADLSQKGGWLAEMIPASTHNVQIRRESIDADFFYVVVYTGASLDTFKVQPI
jgi:hypothetical protein